ncbi:hypothetical protein AVEN_174617-1 [Araneus ventricosus]|uniref:DNA-directed DNA polymerase n=1 Tax=Araneus ventricosus TaxID=182803 RepID=A0A4Y2L2U8_ARAVE|nr:hypothetical protein AVEN_174617-1 [Araneus ventricosus]
MLELSKVLMYDFHYNVIMKKYGDKARLLFTDTDSLCYEITTGDLNKDLERMKNYLDFSDYPKDHPLYSDENKKKIGYFKDELNGQPCLEFIDLRSKMYSILSERDEKQTAKCIYKSVRQQQLKHVNYRQCLLSRKPSTISQNRIGSEKHHIFSMQQSKRALSAFDDKRFLLEDGVTSLSYGHYKIG